MDEMQKLMAKLNQLVLYAGSKHESEIIKASIISQLTSMIEDARQEGYEEGMDVGESLYTVDNSGY